ncbi:TRAP transporter substrate-binding protein [Uliginosibacterium sediminicola]|uniref:TRAP transporter substrate-binding protein n=1 Tax=Uliginosibacterium sediminicola TaxID=2024550 RepID=A0ABU9YWT3_9RHOO
MRQFFVLLLMCLTPLAHAQLELKLSHFGSDEHPANIAAKQLAARVAQRSGGKVLVRIYPNNQLGNPPEVLEQVMLGAVDMSLSGHDQLGKYVPKFDAISTPFAFKDYAAADKLIDGDFRKWVEKDLEAKGMVYLSAWEWGFRQLTNSRRPILKPEDARGLKIRTPPAFAYQAFVEAIGATVQTIQFPELVMAMKTGVVDGQENPVSVIYNLRLNESQKYMSLLNYTYSSMTHVISRQAWDKLSAEQKTILREESAAAGKLMRKLVREEETRQIADLRSLGMRIDQPDTAPFRAVMKPAYDKMRIKIGTRNFEEFMDLLKRNGD